MKCPFCIKKCTKCGELLVAWKGNFVKQKSGKWGLRADCKECNYKRSKQWRKENKEYKKEQDKQYYEEHKEKMLIGMKKYYEEHKEEISVYNKQYREEHKEELKEKKKNYYKNNPHIKFNNSNKRRVLEENQGRGVTREQWFEMMEYFNWCCAYSGEYLGSEKNKDIRSIDHIVALSNNGLNEPWNCIPMIKVYNISKLNRNMEEWYKQQLYFSEERLNKIYEWVEYAYEKWGYKIEEII